MQLLITEAQEKSKRLDQNIVTSPDRISNDIERMEEELTTLNIKYAEAMCVFIKKMNSYFVSF